MIYFLPDSIDERTFNYFTAVRHKKKKIVMNINYDLSDVLYYNT